MATRFASNKRAFGFCDRCGFRYDLKRLKNKNRKMKTMMLKNLVQTVNQKMIVTKRKRRKRPKMRKRRKKL